METKPMKKIEATIQLTKLDEVQAALGDIGIDGMTVCEVKGFGRHNRHTESYRGKEYTVDYLPKVKIDLIVEDQDLEPAVQAIAQAAKASGDRVLISDVREAAGALAI
jgi:nitrogen regulatory protein P-II 1